MRSKLTALRAGPLLPRAALQALVSDHLERVRQAAVRDPFLDLHAAEQVASTLERLLDEWPEEPSCRRHIQSACLYFASDDDAEPDFDSPVGFDDDVEAVNLVLELLGRTDLRIVL